MNQDMKSEMSTSLQFAHIAWHCLSLLDWVLNFYNSHHVSHRCSTRACLVFTMTSLLTSALHWEVQAIAAYSNFIYVPKSPVRWVPHRLITISIWPMRNNPIKEVVWLGQSHKANKWQYQGLPSATVTQALLLTPLGRLWGNQDPSKDAGMGLYLWPPNP